MPVKSICSLNKSCLAIVVLSFCSITLFVTVLVLANRPRDVNVKVKLVPKEICRENYCRKTASDLSDIMDISIDPCEDFYNYTCGRFHVHHPANQTFPMSTNNVLQWKIHDTLSTLLKYFSPNDKNSARGIAAFIYKECVNDSPNENVGDLKTLVEVFGNWPILSDPDNPSFPKEDLQKILEYNTLALRTFNLKIILNFNVVPSPLQPDKFVLTIDKSALFGISETKYAFIQYKVSLKTLVQKLNPDWEKLKQLDKDIADLEMLENEIQGIPNSLPSAPSPDLTDEVRKMAVNLGALNQQLPSGGWIEMLRGVLDDKNINSDYEIIADVPFLKRTFEILEATDIRTVKNWFVAKVLLTLGPKFSSIFDNTEPNERKCAQEVNELMPYATAAVYNQYWSQGGDKKGLVLEIIDEVKKTMETNFNKSSWLSHGVKEKLNAKLKNILPLVGFPDWILKDDELNAYYKIQIGVNDTYVDASKALLGLEWVREARKLKSPFVRENYWIKDFLTVNAAYNPFGNTIILPISILHYPVLPDVSQPRSVTFGILGSVIAHEMFHAFGPFGISFDANGQLWNPFEEAAMKEEYILRLNCLIDQYKNEGSNGALTIAEDFPDNAGIETIFETLSTSNLLHNDLLPNFNQTQSRQFFIAYASFWCIDALPYMKSYLLNNASHPFSPYRATIPLRNSEAFSQVFQCKRGSAMNPHHKCRLF